MSQIAIRAEGLGKQYPLGAVRHNGTRHRYKSLRDSLASATSESLRALRSHRKTKSENAENETFWALKDVSFDIKQGEVVGIIGRNGAGKSTLLKILSRITEPTTGSAEIRGRIASLLEVGTGFHPELTGRENVYMNGAILGMKRAEIERKFDEIVAFAEVERFLGTPVKHYSSGMYVRLAFAVAAHLEQEILVIDEVLAVGDAEFQKKCLGKIEDVAREYGRTILFVSHNMAAIRTLCTRAILLDRGKLQMVGRVVTAIESYLEAAGALAETTWRRPAQSDAAAPAFFTAIEARLQGRQPQLRLTIHTKITCQSASCPKAFVSVDLCDAFGAPLLQAVPIGEPFMEFREGSYLLTITIDLPPLIPGRYTAGAWLGTHYTSTLDYVKNAVSIAIEESPVRGRSFPHTLDHGHLVSASTCEYRQLAGS